VWEWPSGQVVILGINVDVFQYQCDSVECVYNRVGTLSPHSREKRASLDSKIKIALLFDHERTA
jgi:hypothetical protein